MKLFHRGLILIAVPLAFEICFVAVLALLLHNAEQKAYREAHARAVTSESEKIDQLFFKAGNLLAVYGLTHNPSVERQYSQVSREIPQHINELRRLGADSSKESLDEIERTCEQALKLLDHGKMLLSPDAKPVSEMQAYILKNEFESDVKKLMEGLEKFAEQESQNERQEQSNLETARSMVMVCLLIGVILNIVIAVLLAIFFTKKIVERLDVVIDNSNRLAQAKPLNAPIGGKDEIARVDSVFHEMALALHEADEKKKELMHMVSHDLRTPLTSINAMLSLLLAGAGGPLSGVKPFCRWRQFKLSA